MSSTGNQRLWNRGCHLVAGVLSIAALTGLASIAISGDEDAKSQASQPPATSVLPSGSVERFDHSGIAPADPMEADTTGMSVAAYGM
jgi:hypothetical protein